MKNFMYLIIVMFALSYSASAQDSLNYSSTWYYRSCGVTDINNCTSEEFDCLWNKASKIAHGGSITTGIGIANGLISFGIVIGVFSGNLDNVIWDRIFVVTALSSIIGIIIGPPIWITGSARKSQLRKNSHYEAYSSLSLNIAPTINRNHFNNTYSLCLTASLRF